MQEPSSESRSIDLLLRVRRRQKQKDNKQKENNIIIYFLHSRSSPTTSAPTAAASDSKLQIPSMFLSFSLSPNIFDSHSFSLLKQDCKIMNARNYQATKSSPKKSSDKQQQELFFASQHILRTKKGHEKQKQKRSFFLGYTTNSWKFLDGISNERNALQCLCV